MLRMILGVCVLVVSAAVVQAAPRVSGEYIESRSCDVYTGPCFANGEIGLTGREAVMGWRFDSGVWLDEDVSGLGVALVVKASDTLGMGGTFYQFKPDPIQAVIVVDSRATQSQQAALVDFVKTKAPRFTKDIRRIHTAEISLKTDHVTGKAVFAAGEMAKIETRGLKKGDCVCSNETVCYPPLVKVDNSHPAYTVECSFSGSGLNTNWSTINKRGAFLATFAN